MTFEPITTFLLITHVMLSAVWISSLFALYMSFSVANAAGYERLRDFLGTTCRRLLLSSIVLGAVTLMLGIALAELLLGFESALDFGNIRIWPLHIGGALGLMSVLILVMGIVPKRADMVSLLRRFNADANSEIELRVKSHVWRVRAMSAASLGLSLIAAGLMACSRSLS